VIPAEWNATLQYNPDGTTAPLPAGAYRLAPRPLEPTAALIGAVVHVVAGPGLD
jgi:hypothetical protein